MSYEEASVLVEPELSLSSHFRQRLSWKRLTAGLLVAAALATILGFFLQYSSNRYASVSLPEMYIGPIEFKSLPLKMAEDLSLIQGAIFSSEDLLKILERERLHIGRSRLQLELTRVLGRLKDQYRKAVDPHIQRLTVTVTVSNLGGRPFVVEDFRVLQAAFQVPSPKERSEKNITSTMNLSASPPLHVSPSGSVSIKIELPYSSESFLEEQIRTFSAPIGMGAVIETLEVRAKLSTGQTLSRKFDVEATFRNGVRSP